MRSSIISISAIDQGPVVEGRASPVEIYRFFIAPYIGLSTATISCLLPSVTAAKTEKEKIIRQKIKTNAFFSFFLILLLPFHDKTEITIITVLSSAIPRFERNTVIKAVTIKDGRVSDIAVSEIVITDESSVFLKTDGKVIRNNYGAGEVVQLKGTNIGGWLVMENWQCPVNSPDQKTTLAVLSERFGEAKAWELINTYQDNWFTEDDFAISHWVLPQGDLLRRRLTE